MATPTTPHKPIRTGIIGCGFATQTFHAPLIEGTPGLALVAISSSDAAKVHASRPLIDVPGSPEALIARPDLDLIIIPTPNDTHYPLARQALLAGKHVVVDKPFTLTLAQAQELNALARQQGRVLSVFHNRRWDGDFLTVQRLLQSGELGRVVHFESHFDRFRPHLRARWREQPGQGGGLWYDLGAHLLDQALQLFGWPLALHTSLASFREGSQTHDWCHAQLRYDGLRATLHASALVAANDLRFAVHGTRGSYVKHGLDTQEDALKAGARPTWPPQPGWGADTAYSVLTSLAGAPGGDPQSGDLQGGRMQSGAPQDSPQARAWPVLPGHYGAYYAALAMAIRGTAPNPVPAEQAMAVMALIELGLQSATEGRELPTPALADLVRC